MKKLLLSCLFAVPLLGLAQGSPDYTGGMKVKLNEDGSKYFRIISWAQAQANHNSDAAATDSKTSYQMRRARVLMYAQISDKFLILTHFGLNSLNASNMSAVGKDDSAQLFMHDVWAQYKVTKGVDVGGGLHYWNGISRLNNQSTLNMMTLDNNRQSWSTLGLSDQFARHMGIYAKGGFGKFQYRVSINDAIANSLQANALPTNLTSTYNGVAALGSRDAGKAYAGYFEYALGDLESNFLPYKVGTYLGSKEVFNIGAGFFSQPNGTITENNMGQLEGQNVNIFAIDAFYDKPIGGKNAALTAYATYQSNDYGKNYMFGPYGTGSMLYTHVGYALAAEEGKTRFQPYVSYGSNSYNAVNDNRNILGIGANAYLSGHNSKLTLEYKNEKMGNNDTGIISLQAMIYL